MMCYFDGRCSECGAVWILPSRAERRRAEQAGSVVDHSARQHEHDWSLSDDALAQLAVAKRNLMSVPEEPRAS